MDAAARAALIARYREGCAVLESALREARGNELDARPIPGEWTPREIIHHVADSELTSAIRLRRLIAEEDPLIVGYDEAEFARRLRYAERPLGPSLEAIRAARATTADILDRLTESEWSRAGTHSETGRYDVEGWLAIYAAHCHDHAEQLRRTLTAARARRTP